MNETATQDVYALVTDRIITLLEQGTAPWQKPWTGSGTPMNLLTRNQYRGINIWLLASLGYDQNLFLTWKQIKELSASVNKGEKSHIVIFWKRIPKEPKPGDESKEQQYKSLLRYYLVFNVSQCTGIPEHLLPVAQTNILSPLRQCELILEDMPMRPLIQHKEKDAFYDPDKDVVNMPKLNKFKNSESYYCTLFHELVHSTGHESRLHRKELVARTGFGAELYSIEELTAEIGACFLNSISGIGVQQINNSAAYLNGWLEVLKKDKRFIFYASNRAQKAVDFILNVQHKEKDEEIVTE